MQDNNQNKPHAPKRRRFDFLFTLFIVLMVIGAIVLIRSLTL